MMKGATMYGLVAPTSFRISMVLRRLMTVRRTALEMMNSADRITMKPTTTFDEIDASHDGGTVQELRP